MCSKNEAIWDSDMNFALVAVEMCSCILWAVISTYVSYVRRSQCKYDLETTRVYFSITWSECPQRIIHEDTHQSKPTHTHTHTATFCWLWAQKEEMNIQWINDHHITQSDHITDMDWLWRVTDIKHIYEFVTMHNLKPTETKSIIS